MYRNTNHGGNDDANADMLKKIAYQLLFKVMLCEGVDCANMYLAKLQLVSE